MKSKHPLRHEREMRGWSQAKLAREIGTEAITVSRWERSLSTPYPAYREKLCHLFGKDAEELGLLASSRKKVQTPTTPAPSTPAHSLPSSQVSIEDPLLPLAGASNLLIGRDGLLHRLTQRVCVGGTISLAALGGLPGVGKTALAIALAWNQEVREHFRDGILWAGLGLTPNVLGHLSRWGTLLGISQAESKQLTRAEEWTFVLRSTIGTRRMLLIIDDVWQAEHALQLLVGGPQCSHLITTRFPTIGSQVAHDGAITVPELGEEDGVRLLVRFIPELVEQDEQSARTLVRSVGALPLALTLIGKHLQLQFVRRQARRLHTALKQMQDVQQRLQVSLPLPPFDRPANQSANTPISLQSIIAVSDHYLNAQGQAALRALAVFPAKPATFSEEAALVVAQVPAEVLDTLSDAGLLESMGIERYSLHQTIVDYARANSKDSEPLKRFIRYMVIYAQTHQTESKALEMERGSIMEALEQAAHLGEQTLLVRGVQAFAPFLLLHGLYAQAEQHLKQAYEAARALADLSSVMNLLVQLGEALRVQGNYSQAQEYCQQGLEIARQQDRREQISAFLYELGEVTGAQGDYAQAKIYYQEGLTLSRQTENHKLTSTLLLGLGRVVHRQGDLVQATLFCQEGLALARQMNQLEVTCSLLRTLGVIVNDQGDYSQAISYHEEGLTLARQIGHREQISGMLSNLGTITAQQGMYERAQAYYQEALAIAEQMGHRELMARVLSNLGDVANEQGHYAQAQLFQEKALALAREINYPELICFALANLGEIAMKQGMYAQATNYLQEGLTLARITGNPRVIGHMLAEWGELHLKQQQRPESRAYFQELLDLILESIQDLKGDAYYGLARVAASEGNIAEAHKLGNVSLSLFKALGHRRTQEVDEFLTALPQQ